MGNPLILACKQFLLGCSKSHFLSARGEFALLINFCIMMLAQSSRPGQVGVMSRDSACNEKKKKKWLESLSHRSSLQSDTIQLDNLLLCLKEAGRGRALVHASIQILRLSMCCVSGSTVSYCRFRDETNSPCKVLTMCLDREWEIQSGSSGVIGCN